MFETLVLGAVYPSPVQQFKSGIELRDIKCNDDFILLVKLKTNMPSCVTPTSSPRLLAHGWAVPRENILYNKSIQNPTIDTTNKTVRIIVVPYFEPTDPEWKIIYRYADAFPGTIRYAIINPCSGPCNTSLSEEWQNVITILKSKGVKTLGYIFDSHQNIANINYYMKNSPVTTDGIFFDNEGTKNNLRTFKIYADYVHSLGGIVYINPGYNYPYIVDYLTSGAADMVNIHEISVEDSNEISLNDVPSSKVSVILGNVHHVSDMKAKLTEISSKKIGTMYIYANSYHALPTFFAEQIQQASITTIGSD